MEIQEYFRILWRRGWIIVLLAAITAVSAYGFSEMQTPVWKGVSKLHFRPYRADWGLTNTAKEWLPLYRERIQSDQMLRDVIGRLRLDLSYDALKGKIATAADRRPSPSRSKPGIMTRRLPRRLPRPWLRFLRRIKTNSTNSRTNVIGLRCLS